MQSKLNRRWFLKAAGVSAFLPAVVGCSAAGKRGAAESSAAKPNIIFIMADDMGYADLGCYGQKHIQTPNIDRLAEEGMRFTDCYAGSTVCAPCRSVLMTGQHTGHTRVRGNSGKVGGVGPQKRVPLKPEDVTVAEVLKKAGYATGITGKWGLGEPDTTGVPNRQGFDEWFGYLNQRNAHSYYPPYLWRNEKKVILGGNADGKRGTYTHNLFTDFALDFIRQKATKPFFLYCAYTVPHAKYEIPDTAPYTDKDWPADAKVHAAMITLLDKDVGRIMKLLKELDIDKNTIVFFCSDNGAAKRWDGIFDSSGPLRGRKRDMYEGGIRTPMIVRWPGRVGKGAVNKSPWYFADFLPTAADLAETSVPDNIDGISILPLILGEKQNTANRFMYWEFFESGRIQIAVRWRNFKAVRLKPDAPLELYNLDDDIAESTNIAEKYPQVITMIEKWLTTARTESANWPTK